MKVVPWRLLIILLLAAFAGGCGGCQRGSVPEEEGSGRGPAAAATQVAITPGAAVTTPVRAAQGLPTARDLPTMNVERGPAGAMPAEPDDEPADGGEEADEADCSVIADAEPDWGPPPLAVQFSVDYECTDGSATVSWDFGDKSGSSSDDNPTHTYTDKGEYVAVVTISTADGATATDEIDITVESEDDDGEDESPPDVEPENP